MNEQDRKFYFEAMSKIPEQFIDGKTAVCQLEDCIVIMNPDHQPMVYRKRNKAWEVLKP
jgi:hypothetical protein